MKGPPDGLDNIKAPAYTEALSKDKLEYSDYLLENFSNAKVGLFTGLLHYFVACVLCT